MKILVTGSSGFIGRHVVAELELRGYTAIPFDRPDYDVRSADQLSRAFKDDIGGVINLAGMLGTPELFGSERTAAEANILGAINVYDVAAEHGVPVVQIGTGHKGQPNPYAITKACAEDLGIARAQWLGERISVVRAYHVYGPGQLPGSPHGPASVHKFFPTFACRALEKMPLELCGGGMQLIDPVHVSEVAVTLADAIDGPYGEVTEAGCGKPVSVAQVARDIGLAAASEFSVTDTDGRLGEPENADVVARHPACIHQWPHLIEETVGWYKGWLEKYSTSSCSMTS